MSMVVAPRAPRRDKSANGQQKQPQATAEQLRLAQIIDGNGNREEDIQNQLVEKVMEVTGTTEDNARTALYDANNDTGRAIELILENGSFEQSNEWETAGRKKGKNAQTSSSKSFDTFEDEVKDTGPSVGRWERNESRGRGRGRNTNRRKVDHDKPADEEGNRGNTENRDRNRGGRRGRGRGSYNSRGRQPGRGPRRFQGRYNRDKSENEDGGTGDFPNNNFDEGFGTFTNKSAENTNQNWGGDTENWDDVDLKVGTWSNDDSKKQTEKKNDSFGEQWGTDSWADDLTETKVFQSQKAQIIPPTSVGNFSVPNHNQPQGSSAPQSGERINLESLFKKNAGPANGSSATYSQAIGSNGLGSQTGIYNTADTSQSSAPSVIQQLQGQASSLFSDNKPVNDIESSSHLFSSYENQSQSSTTGTLGQYTSTRNSDGSFPQLNGKRSADANDRGSSLLGSFGDQFKSQEKPVLGQMSDISKSAFTPLKPNTNQGGASVIGSEFTSFSQTQQQREATEAVKASLGLSPVANEQMDSDAIRSGLPGRTTAMSQNTLSFGAPLPIRQSKESRRKQPPVNTKIPAAAVEMPGVGGSGYHELSTFDLQFGIDEPAPTNDFGNSNNAVVKPVPAQSSLFSKSAVTSQGSLLNHLPPGSISDSSIFPNQMSGQQSESRPIQRSSYQSLQSDFSQTGKQLGASADSLSLSAQQASDATSVHTSQRFSEAPKQSEPMRGPPGLTHPSSLSSSTNSSGPTHGSNQQSGDLSASYGSSRMVAGSNIPLSGLPSESTHDQASITNPVHSYYTSTSHGQQQQIGTDHANSAGRSIRSPVPSTSLQGSLQGSPMPHMSVTPSKDELSSTVPSTVISSLASGLGQTHISSHTTGSSATSASAPLNIPGAPTTNAPTLGGSGAYGSMGMHLPYSASPQASQSSVIPPVSSPGKHLPSSDLYPSSGLPSSLSHSHQQAAAGTTVSSMIGLALGNAALSSVAGTPKSSTSLSTPSTKTGPPNLPLPGVPPLLPNQYGIPMGATGLMTAYAPEAALYAGYTDPLMAVQSRMVNQVPNYYDVSSFHTSSNPSANPSSVNRDSTSSNVNQGKFNHREPSSPTVGMIGGSVGSGLAQQVAGQHNAQMKASQTGTHQAQPFVNLPTAPAAYPGYANVYYNAFQYPPMFAAAAATAVPQSGKHSVNVTTAFQQHGTGFGNAYSTAASINASSASSLHDLQGQGYNKNHVSAYEKQQAAFHHHTNTPPPAFNLQTLTAAAMAAANTGGAGGGGGAPAMSPYNQSPFMAMLPTQHHSQIHLHVQQQHNDVGQGVGSQRTQNTSSIGKSATKPGFGSAPYWAN